MQVGQQTVVGEQQPVETLISGIVNSIAQQYTKIVRYPMVRVGTDIAPYVERVLIDEYTIVSPRGSTIEARRIVERTKANIIAILIGIIVIVFAFVTLFMGVSKIIVGALLIIGILILLAGLPRTEEMAVSAGEQIFICHHCGKVVLETEAIILRIEGEYPMYKVEDRETGRVTRIGNYYGVHCERCLKKYHPEEYSKLAERGPQALREEAYKLLEKFRKGT